MSSNSPEMRYDGWQKNGRNQAKNRNVSRVIHQTVELPVDGHYPAAMENLGAPAGCQPVCAGLRRPCANPNRFRFTQPAAPFFPAGHLTYSLFRMVLNHKCGGNSHPPWIQHKINQHPSETLQKAGKKLGRNKRYSVNLGKKVDNQLSYFVLLSITNTHGYAMEIETQEVG